MPENPRLEDIEGMYRQVDLDDDARVTSLNDFRHDIAGFVGRVFESLLLIVLFPLKILWNLIVIIAAISLTITWIGFVFGSVLGVILLLIFMGLEGFFFPMGLMALCVPLRD